MACRSEWTAQIWQAQINVPSLSFPPQDEFLNIASVYISKTCWRASCNLRLLCAKIITTIYTKTTRIPSHDPRLLCPSIKTWKTLHNVSVHQKTHIYIQTRTLQTCQHCHCIYQNKLVAFMCFAAAFSQNQNYTSVPTCLCLPKKAPIYTQNWTL